MENYKKTIERLLSDTTIKINGNKPYDIKVINEKFYERVFNQGSLGLGESYMEGWWTCDRLDELLYRIFDANLEEKVKKSMRLKLMYLKSILFNPQSQKRALKAIRKHYDTGNDLYVQMLDPLMNYSCAYWEHASNLIEAQEHKLKLICKKLQLRPGQKVLDIGCGWGGFAFYAAKNYGVQVVGITISLEQKLLAAKMCKGLPIEIRLQDYRNIHESFDRIVSIGMLEHVGPKNYDTFINVVQKNLKDDGICLLHFIGGNNSATTTDPWIDKYIFPGGVIPSIVQIGNALENKLILQDWHNFGPDYDITLMCWLENFKASWPFLKGKYGETFYKMWEFYLCSSAASFRSNNLNLWQLILTKKMFPRTYRSVRYSGITSKENIRLQKTDNVLQEFVNN
jgi:cyclopropane-fatty-acyl-phospholipid synthase